MEDVGLGEILEVDGAGEILEDMKDAKMEESFEVVETTDFVNSVVKAQVDEWGPEKLRWMFLADVTVSLTRILDPTVEYVANNLWHKLAPPKSPLKTPLVTWWLTVPAAVLISVPKGEKGESKGRQHRCEMAHHADGQGAASKPQKAQRSLERFDAFFQQTTVKQTMAVDALSSLLQAIKNPEGEFVSRPSNPLKEGFRFDRPLWTLDFELDKKIKLAKIYRRILGRDDRLMFRQCFHRHFPILSGMDVNWLSTNTYNQNHLRTLDSALRTTVNTSAITATFSSGHCIISCRMCGRSSHGHRIHISRLKQWIPPLGVDRLIAAKEHAIRDLDMFDPHATFLVRQVHDWRRVTGNLGIT